MKDLKSIFRKAAFGFGTLVLLLSVSCKKDRVTPEAGQTITDIVSTDANFSFLRAAVVKAELAATLSGTGPFTVFAPDNNAFRAAGFADEAAVSAASKEALSAILLYHVLASNVTASAIPTAANTEVTTVGGGRAYVTKTSAGAVSINGASVTTADVAASNGTIHVINSVLSVPAGNIVATAQANPNFTYLVAAVLRANLATTLSGTGPFTVFAPTNQAFINAGFPTIASIQAADPTTLASILTYHVIPGRIFSAQLVEGSTPATVNGATVTITLTGGAKVKGRTNPDAATISPANLTTTNGVIHVIDKVLLP